MEDLISRRSLYVKMVQKALEADDLKTCAGYNGAAAESVYWDKVFRIWKTACQMVWDEPAAGKTHETS